MANPTGLSVWRWRGLTTTSSVHEAHRVEKTGPFYLTKKFTSAKDSIRRLDMNYNHYLNLFTFKFGFRILKVKERLA